MQIDYPSSVDVTYAQSREKGAGQVIKKADETGMVEYKYEKPLKIIEKSFPKK